MLVQTVTQTMFIDAFTAMGRKDNFSWEGLEILYDYLWDLSEDIGEPIEFDVIGICCEYLESTAEEIISSYDLPFGKNKEKDEEEVEEDEEDKEEEDEDDEEDGEEDLDELVIEHLQNEGVYIGSTSEGTHVYRQY